MSQEGFDVCTDIDNWRKRRCVDEFLSNGRWGMSQEANKSIVVDLGWCMARLDKNRGYLTFVSPCDSNETSFIPAQSVGLWRQADILTLRDFLNEQFPN